MAKEKSTTLTSKGQITIPKEIREQLDLSTGDRFMLQVKQDGAIELRKLSAVERLRRTLGAELRRQGLTHEEMDRLLDETRSGLVEELYDDSES